MINDPCHQGNARIILANYAMYMQYTDSTVQY